MPSPAGCEPFGTFAGLDPDTAVRPRKATSERDKGLFGWVCDGRPCRGDLRHWDADGILRTLKP